MRLKNIFAKRMLVAEGLRVPVSRHFHYSTFGVRSRYDNHTSLSLYIVEGKPGTGFFVRNSESHSYRRFVNESKKALKQNMMTLLLRREPDFGRESKLVDEWFVKAKNEGEKHILSHYQNVISLAKDEELLQRIVRAVKDKMGDRSRKSMVSVISHYKSSIANLERDVRSAQIDYASQMDEVQAAAWQKVVDAFHLLVESRRVWSVYRDGDVPAYQQVFFDMGVFDYILVPGDTPVMRDHTGMHYYLLPDGLVAARSSVDFDFIPLEELEVEFNVVDISTLAVRPQFNSHKHRRASGTDALSTLYGVSRAQVVGELYLPQIDRRWFVNHTGPAEDFVKAVKDFRTVSKKRK